MGIISCDFNIIGWQQLRSRPKVLGTYIEIFVYVNTHDQKNFWFGLSHDNYLKYDMAENIEGSVIIEDIDTTVFKKMLRFMYTGEVEKLESIAIALAVAADKYDLDSLKVMCEIHLSKNLTKDNVVDILQFAVEYRAAALKNNALEFINANATDLVNTKGYKSFCKSDQLRECYELLIKKLELYKTRN